MGCLLSKLYDKGLRKRVLKRSQKYRLNDEEVETKTLSPSSATVPNYSSSSTARATSGSTAAPPQGEPKKEYSWDKRRKLDPKDFMCMNMADETIVREPGKVNGEQFVVDGCKRCNIFVFDHCASVTIDDCTNCTIYIGPTESSVFIRNCKKCYCVFLCRQLRTRDCEDCTLRLFCATRPVIESSKAMRFACFDTEHDEYEQLPQQLSSAHLSPFCNYWSSVYDFTPQASSSNWSFWDADNLESKSLQDEMASAEILAQKLQNGLVSPDEEDKCTFSTLGEKPLDNHDYHYLVLFPLRLKIQERGAVSACKAFLNTLAKTNKGVKLVQVNGCKLTKDEMDELNSNNILESGSVPLPPNSPKVVGVEIASEDSVKSAVIQSIGSDLSKYNCVLVDNVDLMRAFRTKGITG